MGLLSWQSFSAGTGITHGAEVISSLSGDSVFLRCTTPGTRIQYVPLSGQPQGVSSGRVRGIFRCDSTVPNNIVFGLTAQQQARNALLSGDLYAFQYGGGTSALQIRKHGSGLGETGTLLASIAYAISANVPHFLEGRWVTDSALGGVYLDVVIGQGLSFAATFSASVSTIDTGAPFLSGVTEGFFLKEEAGTTATFKIVIDDVQLFTSAP